MSSADDEAGIGGIETVDIRQDDQQVRVGKMDHHARKIVVVAELDLIYGNGVVLVDDGHDAVLEEHLERVSRVQEPYSVRQVLPVSSIWATFLPWAPKVFSYIT